MLTPAMPTSIRSWFNPPKPERNEQVVSTKLLTLISTSSGKILIPSFAILSSFMSVAEWGYEIAMKARCSHPQPIHYQGSVSLSLTVPQRKSDRNSATPLNLRCPALNP